MFVGVLITPPQMKQQAFYTLHWGRSSSLHVVVLKFKKKTFEKHPYFSLILPKTMWMTTCMHQLKIYMSAFVCIARCTELQRKKFLFENFFKKLFCSHSEIKYKVEKIPEAVTQTTASEILAQGFPRTIFFCRTPPDDSV